MIESVPITRGMKPAGETSRDRVLSEDELRAVWGTTVEVGWPFGPFVQTMILTGQRRDEVSGMGWAELDLDGRLWTLPAERNKSVRIFEVPLSDTMVDIIKGTSRLSDEFVFTSGRVSKTGGGKPRPISGYSKFKRELDDKSGVTGNVA